MLTVEIDEEEYYDAVWNLTTAETCVNTEEFPEDDPSFQSKILMYGRVGFSWHFCYTEYEWLL